MIAACIMNRAVALALAAWVDYAAWKARLRQLVADHLVRVGRRLLEECVVLWVEAVATAKDEQSRKDALMRKVAAFLKNQELGSCYVLLQR